MISVERAPQQRDIATAFSGCPRALRPRKIEFTRQSLPPGWPLQYRPERVGGLAHDPAAVVVGEPGQCRLAESHLAEVPTYTGRGEVGTPHDASWREGLNHASEELLLGWGQVGISLPDTFAK